MVTFRQSWETMSLGGVGARFVLAAMLVAPTTAWPSSPATGQEETPSAPPLSDAERETFLLEGEVVADRSIPEGITLPRRVTLRWGEYEHDAQVQTHDEHRSQLRLGDSVEIDFRDTWRNNVAAYRLDRLLGLGFVPVTVVREYRRQPAAWMWWVDDVLMSERDRLERRTKPPKPLAWVCQIHVVRVFDQLIHNFDRSAENLLIDQRWQAWMIDHTRSFKRFGDLRNPENLPTRCEKSLLAALRSLDRPLLQKSMEGLLDGQQLDGLVARRDKIVRFYDAQIAARGDSAVLYELPSRAVSRTEPGREPSPR